MQVTRTIARIAKWAPGSETATTEDELVSFLDVWYEYMQVSESSDENQDAVIRFRVYRLPSLQAIMKMATDFDFLLAFKQECLKNTSSTLPISIVPVFYSPEFQTLWAAGGFSKQILSRTFENAKTDNLSLQEWVTTMNAEFTSLFESSNFEVFQTVLKSYLAVPEMSVFHSQHLAKLDSKGVTIPRFPAMDDYTTPPGFLMNIIVGNGNDSSMPDPLHTYHIYASSKEDLAYIVVAPTPSEIDEEDPEAPLQNTVEISDSPLTYAFRYIYPRPFTVPIVQESSSTGERTQIFKEVTPEHEVMQGGTLHKLTGYTVPYEPEKLITGIVSTEDGELIQLLTTVGTNEVTLCVSKAPPQLQEMLKSLDPEKLFTGTFDQRQVDQAMKSLNDFARRSLKASDSEYLQKTMYDELSGKVDQEILDVIMQNLSFADGPNVTKATPPPPSPSLSRSTSPLFGASATGLSSPPPMPMITRASSGRISPRNP